MNKRIAALLLAVACSGSVPGPGSEAARPAEPAAFAGPASLWQKAVDLYQRNRSWYPERIFVVSEVLNRRGQPYSVTHLDFAVRAGRDGRLRTELTRASKNGKDTTEKMKAKVEIRTPQDGIDTEKEESYSVSISDSPFDPERQGAVSHRPNGNLQTIFGRTCHRFDFSYRTEIVRKGEVEKLTWVGMAWLEEGSGTPVKMEFTLDPLPSRIRSLWTIYLYDITRADRWVVKRVSMSGHGGFLFITKRFRSATVFSNYRRLPSNGGAK